MAVTYEVGRVNLEILVQKHEHLDRNEATTRLQLIDRLLFECLGWSQDEVIAEESESKQYADYTFLAPRRILILEAKREGQYFELPAGEDRLIYALPSLLKDYPDLKAAVRQATDYCQSRGVPFGAVSNGHQIVAFVAVRTDGVPPLEGKAIVFPSLTHMLANFLQLWQVLSKPGVEEKNLKFRLVGQMPIELPAKPSASLLDYPGIKNRNIFQTDLQIVAELVIEDVPRAPELEQLFLERCYCESGALSQHSLVSKTILEARYAALFDATAPGPTTVPAKNRKGISPDLLAQSLSRRPILLIGDVGVGKSIFIRHLTVIAAAEVFADAVELTIDLGSQAALTFNLRKFVLDQIISQLREKYETDIFERSFVLGAYDLELKRFAKGIYGVLKTTHPDEYQLRELGFLHEKLQDPEQHLKAALEHIAKARKKQIVMFIDNADQRDEHIQQEAFLIAEELAASWPVTVFVTLRPETFYRSLKIGALTGYHPKAFTISPPRVNLVIEKRLQFALEVTTGKVPIPSLSEEIKVHFTKLDGIIRAFIFSLQNNQHLRECIDNISGGNVRRALDFVRDFFGSGHVDTQKISAIYDQQQRYDVPLHEFLRAIIYDDTNHYDPDKSPIANLFDVAYPDPREHFLLPLVINLLRSASGPGVEQGFVETTRIYDQLQGLGFSPDQIDAVIVRGTRANLLETVARRMPLQGQGMPPAFRVTSVGAYHVERLCQLFTYVDAVIVDTPIFDTAVREKMKKSRSIEERLERAETFRTYLDQKWAPFDGLGTTFSWPDMSNKLHSDITAISTRVRSGKQIEML